MNCPYDDTEMVAESSVVRCPDCRWHTPAEDAEETIAFLLTRPYVQRERARRGAPARPSGDERTGERGAGEWALLIFLLVCYTVFLISIEFAR